MMELDSLQYYSIMKEFQLTMADMFELGFIICGRS